MSSLLQASVALLAASLAIPTHACLPPRQENGTTSGQYPYPEMGPEGSDPSTTGIYLNHFSLNVANITRSIDFYSKVFGMRHMFTLHASPHFNIAYMAHSHGGKNGTGYQTTEELIREKNNAQGLLEMINLDVPDNKLPAGTDVANTFGHIGIVVPDMDAMQRRLDDHGVTILKRIGEPLPKTGILARSQYLGRAEELLDPAERALVEQVLDEVNKPLIFAMDPDGNALEIQVQGGAPLF